MQSYTFLLGKRHTDAQKILFLTFFSYNTFPLADLQAFSALPFAMLRSIVCDAPPLVALVYANGDRQAFHAFACCARLS